MKKKYIIITGGAGFVGSNLIKYIIKKTKFNIISIDNYSTGKIKNHILDKKIKYINDDTKNISKILKTYKSKINSIFHFGEFARIYQSFVKMSECINSNSIGTNAVFNYCLKNKIKLIYSATSASIIINLLCMIPITSGLSKTGILSFKLPNAIVVVDSQVMYLTLTPL